MNIYISKITAKSIRYFLSIILGCLPGMAFAVTVSADVMLENINTQLPYLYALISGGVYIFGIVIFIRGVSKLREVAESSSGRAQRSSLTEPLAHMILGVALIYLPTSMDVMLATVYGTSAITPYSGYGPTGGSFNEMAQVIINIVQFVGFIAFVRGLILFHRLGTGQAQQGTFNKGFTHLIGGIIAINVVQFINIIGNTLGITA